MAIDPFTIARLGIGAGQLARGISTMRDRRNDRRGQERIRNLLAQAQGRNLRNAQAIAGSGVGVSPALAQRAALDSVNESNQAATQAAMDQESALALQDRERADRLAGAELGAIGAFGSQLLTAMQESQDDGDDTDEAERLRKLEEAMKFSSGAQQPAQAATAAGEAAQAATGAGEAAAGAVPPLDGLAALGATMDQEAANENLLSQFLGGQLTPEQMSALEGQYAPVEQPANMSIEGLGMTPGATPTAPLDAFSPGELGAVDPVGMVQSNQAYDARNAREAQRRAARNTRDAASYNRVSDLSRVGTDDMVFDINEAEGRDMEAFSLAEAEGGNDMTFNLAEAEADDMTFDLAEAEGVDEAFTMDQADQSAPPNMVFGIEEAELGGRPDMAFDSRQALGVDDPGLAYRANPFGVDTSNTLPTQNARRPRNAAHRAADAVFNTMSIGTGDAPVVERSMLYESPELVSFFTPTGDRNNLDILARGGVESQGAMTQLVNILGRTSSAHTAREHAQRILTRALALRSRQMEGM